MHPRTSISRSAALLALLCGALLLTAREATAALFDAPFIAYDTGPYPNSVAIADLNGDGRPDVVVSNQIGSSVSVLLGRSDGSLAPKLDFATGASSSPMSVAIADLDGDGRLDVVVASEPNTVSVLLGNGDGSLRPRTDYPAGANPYSVGIGDLNGDGRLDIVVANHDAATVSVLMGNGDGTFRPKTDFAAGGQPQSLAIGDLNGDGVPDVAVATQAVNAVSVLLGKGDGTLGPAASFGTGSAPFSVAIGDVDGDGKPDLVTADFGSSTVSILPGNGDGGFRSRLAYATGYRPLFVAIGDLNGDGRADLVAADMDGVSVLLGKGGGTFGAKTDYPTAFSQAVAIGDLNLDGRPDLVAANSTDSTAAVLLGNGDGSFGLWHQYRTGTGPNSVAIGDLDGDGVADVVTADFDSVGVFLGRGDGTFGAESSYWTGIIPPGSYYPGGIPGGYPLSVAIDDLNGDGVPDVVTFNSDSTISVLAGGGGGRLGAGRVIVTAWSPVAMGDLNGDGHVDIVTRNGLNNSLSVLLGNGDGTFRPRMDFTIGPAPSNGPSSSSVAIGDLDGDGKPDLVVGDTRPDTVSDSYIVQVGDVLILLGNGDGTFRTGNSYRMGTFQYNRQVGSVAIGDLNGDGRPDLVVSDDLVTVMLGRGDGNFGAKTDYGPWGTQSIGLADVDGDGKLDVVANKPGSGVSVLLGRGDGTLIGGGHFGAGYYSTSLAIGDLDHDGRPDVVTGNVNNRFTVLLNTAPGGITPTLLSLFDARWTASGVEVRWRLGEGASVRAVVLQRSEGAAGPWARVPGSPRLQDGVVVQIDAGVTPGRSYDYRLQATLADGQTTTFGPVEVAGAPPAAFALLPIEPNPIHGVASITYAVPRASWIRLSVLDVQGRRVATLANGQVTAGSHTMDLRADVTPGMGRAGIFFARLEWPGGSETRRLAVVR